MEHLIASYGYLAIFLLMVAESACIPVPSELTMTFGGALAAGAVAGAYLNLVLVIAVGVAGNVVGSYIAWAVGLYGGQAALRRWGKRLWIREHDIDRATVWFERNGPRAVLLGRLLPVVRTFISLPAGIAGMRPLRFGIYTTIGVIPWTAALAGAGYAVGSNWQSISNGFKGPTYIIAAIVVVALAVLIVRHVRRRPAGNHAATGRGPQTGRARDPQTGPGRDPQTGPGRDSHAGPGRDSRSDTGWPLRSGTEKEQ
jgi:membrane protein DedA with SNARE-associated domain